MTTKIYLSPNTVTVIREQTDRVVNEVRLLRRGHELHLWEDTVDEDAIAGEEDDSE